MTDDEQLARMGFMVIGEDRYAWGPVKLIKGDNPGRPWYVTRGRQVLCASGRRPSCYASPVAAAKMALEKWK